jgi:hypothetical protein
MASQVLMVYANTTTKEYIAVSQNNVEAALKMVLSKNMGESAVSEDDIGESRWNHSDHIVIAPAQNWSYIFNDYQKVYVDEVGHQADRYYKKTRTIKTIQIPPMVNIEL